MFQILSNNCVNNLSDCCGDFAIVKYLEIIKKALNLIHIIVPIILIVMVVVQLSKLLINPDDQNNKEKKSLFNKVIATVIIFFIPTVVNVIMSLLTNINQNFEIPKCWKNADDIIEIMNQNN